MSSSFEFSASIRLGSNYWLISFGFIRYPSVDDKLRIPGKLTIGYLKAIKLGLSLERESKR